MAVSTQVKNVKVGACSASYKGADLGLTKGGCEVNIVTNKHEVTVDQFGTSVVNSVITGRQVTVKVPMAETDFTKLLAVIPGATLVTDAVTSTKKKIVIPHSAGYSLADVAGELILHPTANSASNKNDDVVAPLCTPGGDITFSLTVDGERVYNIEFTVYPDESTGTMLILGDKTAT